MKLLLALQLSHLLQNTSTCHASRQLQTVHVAHIFVICFTLTVLQSVLRLLLQYPGYVLFQENTSRVCQATITQQCLDQNNGDEDLCLVMLIAATLNNQGSGGVIWTPGAIAGVAIAGMIAYSFAVVLTLLLIAESKRRRCCCVVWPCYGYITSSALR